jgi:HAD superfamily hydrolase (TIGR01509 family)
MIKAVIFDMDGTLIDSNDFHARSWQEILAKHGHEFTFEQVRRQIGKGGDQLMPVFLSEEELERDGERIEEERTELFKREYLPRIEPFPMTRELFERIKRDGKQVVLASSSKGKELDAYKKIARIDDLIEEATSSDDAERSKPHPDIFEAALTKLDGVAPEEAIVVGDTPYDAQAAGKAGLATIGLLCGGFPEAELRAAGCIAIFRDPADLLARYDESPIGRGQIPS